MNRIEELEQRHFEKQLSNDEVIELFEYQKGINKLRSSAYSQLVAAMFVFVPYLEDRPQLIGPFVEALFASSRDVFAGVNGKAGFWQFLASKSQVDDGLKLAVQKHRPVFEAELERLMSD